ncbi:MAG TPA: laccase domain-containing protein [Eggerthellaceae bacterium]|nr:laccase domain-containing protein [Eggerthellaceae bacterium]
MPLPKPTIDALPLGAHRLLTLTDEQLYRSTGVRIAFTGRDGGVSAGEFASLNLGENVHDDERAVLRNRALVLEALGAPGAALVMPHQVHGTHIVEISPGDDVRAARDEAQRDCDGLVVRAPGVAGGLIAADCLLLAIVAPDGTFALTHAGWRGAVAGIAGKTARLLAARAGDAWSAADMNAYIGPHIGPECFEVGPEVAERFERKLGADALEDARHVNLARAVSIDLRHSGMRPERIAQCGICTVCNSDRYYSYRASGGKCGRHGMFAWRAG